MSDPIAPAKIAQDNVVITRDAYDKLVRNAEKFEVLMARIEDVELSFREHLRKFAGHASQVRHQIRVHEQNVLCVERRLREVARNVDVLDTNVNVLAVLKKATLKQGRRRPSKKTN
jgi:hypothetical protein